MCRFNLTDSSKGITYWRPSLFLLEFGVIHCSEWASNCTCDISPTDHRKRLYIFRRISIYIRNSHEQKKKYTHYWHQFWKVNSSKLWNISDSWGTHNKKWYSLKLRTETTQRAALQVGHPSSKIVVDEKGLSINCFTDNKGNQMIVLLWMRNCRLPFLIPILVPGHVTTHKTHETV